MFACIHPVLMQPRLDKVSSQCPLSQLPISLMTTSHPELNHSQTVPH